ncbi:hypothetical protein H6P81_012251 [Aristolochia fimbriata]|uniref:TCP domain-containing protein n=1 Tax=Aristolochia fimbriata TaxID=158543 RepID=A0AAV7EBE3_ARIFI|nr:hypothetical protein H6P81_012251 [Aristolochia fimbriata]
MVGRDEMALHEPMVLFLVNGICGVGWQRVLGEEEEAGAGIISAGRVVAQRAREAEGSEPVIKSARSRKLEEEKRRGLDPPARTHHHLILKHSVGGGEGQDRGRGLGEEPVEPPKKRSYQLASTNAVQYARFESNSTQQQQQQQQAGAPSSRLGLRAAAAAAAAGGGGGGGEIVEVQGGHIVRSTGRKDRHSKVCTAKGPRDRRVRLSAHTAIQFYDVQDRLGYDRPSKAVDWLIKKAKAAIDELEELPAWHPTAALPPPPNLGTHKLEQEGAEDEEGEEGAEERNRRGKKLDVVGSAGKKPMEEAEQSGYGFQRDQQTSGGGGGTGSGALLPPSLDSDAIADTIKSFFPMASSSSSIHFQNYPPDLLSRTSSQAQDLRLSLQSFQDPILLHHHQHQHHQHQAPPSEQAFFSVTAPMTFDTAASSTAWSEHHQQSMARFHRMVAWNPADPAAGGGGYVFGQGPQSATQLLAQNQFFPQRGPLQSSNSPSVRAWAVDPTTIADHPSLFHSSSATGFASGTFSGFRIPARIQGEEEHDAVGTKPASSASRH